MADEKKEESASAYVTTVRNSIRADLEAEYQQREQVLTQDFTERLRTARAEIRKAQNEANAAQICQITEDRDGRLAEAGRRLGEYRRGHWYDLAAVTLSAVGGFTAGLLAQKAIDARVAGVPLLALLGAPGLLLGHHLDESITARASLAVGGTMFTVGTFAYAYCNPTPEDKEPTG